MGEVYLCLDLEAIQSYTLKTFRTRYLTNNRMSLGTLNAGPVGLTSSLTNPA